MSQKLSYAHNRLSATKLENVSSLSFKTEDVSNKPNVKQCKEFCMQLFRWKAKIGWHLAIYFLLNLAKYTSPLLQIYPYHIYSGQQPRYPSYSSGYNNQPSGFTAQDSGYNGKQYAYTREQKEHPQQQSSYRQQAVSNGQQFDQTGMYMYDKPCTLLVDCYKWFTRLSLLYLGLSQKKQQCSSTCPQSCAPSCSKECCDRTSQPTQTCRKGCPSSCAPECKSRCCWDRRRNIIPSKVWIRQIVLQSTVNLHLIKFPFIYGDTTMSNHHNSINLHSREISNYLKSAIYAPLNEIKSLWFYCWNK